MLGLCFCQARGILHYCKNFPLNPDKSKKQNTSNFLKWALWTLALSHCMYRVSLNTKPSHCYQKLTDQILASIFQFAKALFLWCENHELNVINIKASSQNKTLLFFFYLNKYLIWRILNFYFLKVFCKRLTYIWCVWSKRWFI